MADAYVIANASCGRPLQDRHVVLYMANMAWNSSMKSAAVMKMLTDKGGWRYNVYFRAIIYSVMPMPRKWMA